MNNLGERLFKLRKDRKLSQEEVAEKLNVTRQTVSKWETNQSMPDFDKVVPLCELYSITPDELFIELKERDTFKNPELVVDLEDEKITRGKKAMGIAFSIVLYFLSVGWIMIAIPVMNVNPILASALFLLICGIATSIIVYVCLKYRKIKYSEAKETNKLEKQISNIIGILVTIVYLIISFKTMAWHLTWIIWIIYGLFGEILKLIFMLRGFKNEK